MNKPDWDDAPEWANWLAMDSDCTWYWFENKPEKYVYSHAWNPEGRFKIALEANDWQETLEKRP